MRAVVPMEGVAPVAGHRSLRGRFRHRARRLWQALPENPRRALLFAASAAIAPRPDPDPPHGSKVGIVGIFRSASGLGEGARLALDALQRGGFQPSAHCISALFGHGDMAFASSRYRPVGDGAETLVVHINGPYLPVALWALGRRRVRAKRIVGYWTWELPRMPAHWRRAAGFAHEIWVPSRFVQKAVAALTHRPVRVVPPPLSAIDAQPIAHEDLGIARDAVVVLHVSNVACCAARKNPLGAIEAFRRAFGDRRDRVLLLKFMGLETAPEVRHGIENAANGAPNIRMIDHMVTRAELSRIMNLADIGLSLHRSEGFGLFPAEMMHIGKPVIATGWSGNMDYMDPTNSMPVSYRMVPVRDPQHIYEAPDQEWAEPDLDHAAALLRSTAADPELRRHIGIEASRAIHDRLDVSRYSGRIAEALGSEAACARPI